jgi:hypothetical protein
MSGNLSLVIPTLEALMTLSSRYVTGATRDGGGSGIVHLAM